MTNTLTGKSLIGGATGSGSDSPIFGVNPATGENLQPPYPSATSEEVDNACKLAAEAFGVTSRLSGKDKATFLRKVADNIEAVAEDLVERATAETGLPEPRIRMETGRTCGQLRLFASLVEEVPGSMPALIKLIPNANLYPSLTLDPCYVRLAR